MSKFEVHPIRAYDANGHLTAAGLQWLEPRQPVLFVGTLMMSLCAPAALLSLLGVAIGTVSLSLAVATVSLSYLGYSICHAFGARDRAVIFERDGGISTPFGLPFYRRTKKIGWPPSRVRSIERWQPAPPSWRIDMYMADGEVIVLGVGLGIYEAHKVVVQLNLAIDDVRRGVRTALSGVPDQIN